MNAMKSACAEVSESLAAFLLGEAGPDETFAVQAHLASCPACRDEAAALENVFAALGSAPPLPADYAESMARRMRERLRARRSPWRVPLVAAASLVAALALALLAPAPEPSLDARVAAKARALNASERTTLMVDFSDAEEWRRDGALASALAENLAGNGWERALPANGFSLENLAEDEWNLLYEFVSGQPERDAT